MRPIGIINEAIGPQIDFKRSLIVIRINLDLVGFDLVAHPNLNRQCLSAHKVEQHVGPHTDRQRHLSARIAHLTHAVGQREAALVNDELLCKHVQRGLAGLEAFGKFSVVAEVRAHDLALAGDKRLTAFRTGAVAGKPAQR